MFGDRIKLRREQLGWSQDELAQRMGYKYRSAINKIETGKNGVPQSKIKKFSDVLGVSIPWLMELEESSPQQDNHSSILSQEKEQHSNVPAPNFTHVFSVPQQIYIYSGLSCGTGQFVEEEAEDVVAVPSEMLNPAGEYFGNRADGDSMQPTIQNGDIVIFEKAQAPGPGAIESGCIGSFSLNGEYYCKRFKRYPDGQICLLSDNIEYAPIRVTPEDDFRVLGTYRCRITKH